LTLRAVPTCDKGRFHGFVGAEAVGSSAHHSNLVVEALDDADGNLKPRFFGRVRMLDADLQRLLVVVNLPLHYKPLSHHTKLVLGITGFVVFQGPVL